MTALPNYSTTVDIAKPQTVTAENWKRDLEKENNEDEGRLRRQHKTELDEDKCSVAYITLGAKLLRKAQNPLDTFPRNFRVHREVANLLPASYSLPCR